MQKRQRQAWMTAAVGLIALLLFTISGCHGTRVGVGHYPEPYDHHGRGYEHPEARGGPPPWAPAHGYRAKQYRYYPSVQVYFDMQRDVYFYYRNGDWRVSASLPGRIRTSMGRYVTLEMETDRPYKYHGEVVREYPPGLSKGRGKGK